MQIIWAGNYQRQPTGYGRLARELMPRIRDNSDHEVVQYAVSGLQNTMPFETNGIKTYGPSSMGGNLGVADFPVVDHIEDADLWILNFDAWAVGELLQQMDLRYVAYAPCVPGATSVVTDEGVVPISAVVDEGVGSQVLGVRDGGVGLTPIRDRQKFDLYSDHLVTIRVEDGQELKMTPEHPVYVKGRGYVQASTLGEGDVVYTHYGVPRPNSPCIHVEGDGAQMDGARGGETEERVPVKRGEGIIEGDGQVARGNHGQGKRPRPSVRGQPTPGRQVDGWGDATFEREVREHPARGSSGRDEQNKDSYHQQGKQVGSPSPEARGSAAVDGGRGETADEALSGEDGFGTPRTPFPQPNMEVGFSQGNEVGVVQDAEERPRSKCRFDPSNGDRQGISSRIRGRRRDGLDNRGDSPPTDDADQTYAEITDNEHARRGDAICGQTAEEDGGGDCQGSVRTPREDHLPNHDQRIQGISVSEGVERASRGETRAGGSSDRIHRKPFRAAVSGGVYGARNRTMGGSSEPPTPSRITEVRTKATSERYVYDLSTGSRNFFLNGILTHNCDHDPIAANWMQPLQNAYEVVPYCEFGHRVMKTALDDVEEGDKVQEPIYHGIDPEVFAPNDATKEEELGVDEDTFVIGIFKNNQGTRANFDRQLRAIKLFINEYDLWDEALVYLHTTIQGQGAFTLPVLINRLDMGSVVQFQDQNTSRWGVDDEVLVNKYNACDVVLNCTRGEGFGFPIVEAFATETSVVAGAYSSMPELVNDEEGEIKWEQIDRDVIEAERGWLVPVWDVECTLGKHSWRRQYRAEHIAKALGAAYENPEARASKGEAAREWVQQFDWDTIGRQWVHYLDDLEERTFQTDELGIEWAKIDEEYGGVGAAFR